MLTAICFNLDQSNILWSGNGLMKRIIDACINQVPSRLCGFRIFYHCAGETGKTYIGLRTEEVSVILWRSRLVTEVNQVCPMRDSNPRPPEH